MRCLSSYSLSLHSELFATRALVPETPRGALKKRHKEELVFHEGTLGFFGEVFVTGLFSGNANAENGTAVEFSRRGVLLADRITAVETDTETITRQSEFARLGF